jgi:hypothetical protein
LSGESAILDEKERDPLAELYVAWRANSSPKVVEILRIFGCVDPKVAAQGCMVLTRLAPRPFRSQELRPFRRHKNFVL